MKKFVALLIASMVVGFVSSEISIRRNAGRLQQVEARLAAIDKNLTSLNERHAKIESALEFLLKADDTPSHPSNQGTLLPSSFATQLAFTELKTKTENALQGILEALETHDEQITQLQDDLASLADDVEKNTTVIAGTGKQ